MLYNASRLLFNNTSATPKVICWLFGRLFVHLLDLNTSEVFPKLNELRVKLQLSHLVIENFCAAVSWHSLEETYLPRFKRVYTTLDIKAGGWLFSWRSSRLSQQNKWMNEWMLLLGNLFNISDLLLIF